MARFPQAVLSPTCLCGGGSKPEPPFLTASGQCSPGKLPEQWGQELSGLQHKEQGIARNRSAGEWPLLPKCSASSSNAPDQGGCVCAGAACHSSITLFPRSYSLAFLSSVCFVSAFNEQEEKGRSLDKSDQGADTLRPPPAGMPSPALMRGRGEREVAAVSGGPRETLSVRDREKRSF